MEQKAAASGSMKISENVICTIVRTVLSEIDGVHSLASRTAGESGWKSPVLSPVTVSLEADVAVIDIGINLAPGSACGMWRSRSSAGSRIRCRT